MLKGVLAWVAGASLVAFVLFAFDKRRAVRGGRRVPERTLLLWTFLLGAPGAYAGSRLFHHKTRKRSFRVRMAAVTALEVVLVGGVWWLARR